jgi:SPX domain protein involved in polyphosphate accumulation
VTRDVKGPEWIHRLDIIGRVIEVAGLSLVLQSMVVLYLTVSILPIWAYTIVKQEIQLSKNELIDY